MGYTTPLIMNKQDWLARILLGIAVGWALGELLTGGIHLS
jgi:hypothetical protein